MSAPKSILKNKTAGPGPSAIAAGPSRLTGSKLRQSITAPRTSAKKSSKRQEVDSDEDGSDEGMSDAEGEEGEGDEEIGTDEEIEIAKRGGERDKSGQKRKRPTTASEFGTTLTSLLAPTTVEPSVASKKSKKSKTQSTAQTQSTSEAQSTKQAQTAILSLSRAKPPPSAAADKLARLAEKRLKVQKAEKEDHARVRDVVEGWSVDERLSMGGMEFERSLRKTAQRGVLKLFNAILVASKNAEAATTSLSAKAGVRDEAAKRKEKDNVLGRGGKEAALTKESFLDLVRKG
ncbi:Rrp15p-domain-containing protein [Naematelia encephala]|uniref:Rrp15p-domain-containing protein n=1 Tax=Naematelia encephala TaxID=71784 RepID=A0A1Y2ALG8_9TREE|nr:Rrp15p-domain-containing protein [Naematelia encephala]